MKSRFKRELHEFLIHDDISLESNVVNALIYQMIGIKLDDEEEAVTHCGFKLGKDYWSERDNKEEIRFNLPKLKMPQLLQCLDFFQFPRDEYETNSSLKLDETFVFDVLLKQFKEYYNHLKATNPQALVQYKTQSRAILESSAISTLREYTKKAVDTILTDKTLDASSEVNTLMDDMLLLEAKANKVREKAIFYKFIIATAPKIDDILKSPILSQSAQLKKQLTLVSEGIALFARYHRFESALANETFMKEIETFLNDNYQISSSQCDVIEETLLRLAKAEIGKEGNCKIRTGSDAARMVFKFIDMNKENAEKVVGYCRELGDETACEGHGYSHHGSSIPEHCLESAVMRPQRYEITPRKVLESHSIEIDGKFAYEEILPRLKQEIHLMETSAPEVLNNYREASKEFLDKLPKPVTPVSQSKSALFQLPVNELVVSEQAVVASLGNN